MTKILRLSAVASLCLTMALFSVNVFAGKIPLMIPVQADSQIHGDPEPRIPNVINTLFRPSDHCVVLLGFNAEGQAKIGDPANFNKNPNYWSEKKLKSVWRGVGFRVIRREEDQPHARTDPNST